MLSLLFVIMMCAILFNVLGFAMKAAWGIGKFILMGIILPLFIISFIIAGIVHFIIPAAIIILICSLIKKAAVNA